MIKLIGYYLNYIWRVVATGGCFLFFSLGAVFLVYVIIPIAGKSKVQQVIREAFRLFVFALRTLGLMQFKFMNLEKLQNDHGCVIVSNHPTLIDYVVIVSKLKQCNTIVKEALWQNIFFKKLIQLAGYIPNQRFIEILPLIQNSLQSGNNLLIFPEGSRTTPGKPAKFKRGAAQIALKLGVPIRVIKISCNPSTLTKNNKWYNIPKTKPLYTLEVGELIDSNAFLSDTPTPSLSARKLTQYLQNVLNLYYSMQIIFCLYSIC